MMGEFIEGFRSVMPDAREAGSIAGMASLIACMFIVGGSLLFLLCIAMWGIPT